MSCTSYLRLLITTFVSFDHCLVLPTYGFWLPLLYLLTTVLYFLLTLLITTFVSFDHSLVFPTYGFWLLHLYLLTTVLYFLLTASDYYICIFWPLSCISYLRLLITTFVSFDHRLVLPTYGFWLPHLYLLTTALYFLLTGSDYNICIFWPLSCTSYLRLLITTFVSFDHRIVLPTYGFWLLHLYLLTTVLYFLLTSSDYHICIFWPLSCTSYLWLLITTFVSFDHSLVFPTYGFWLPHLYLLTTVLYFLLTASDCYICIFWPLSCISYLGLLITTFVSFDHRLVLPTYGFWLLHLYLLTTVLYFLLTSSDYHICIFWPLSCTSYLRLLITTFVSFDHSLVFPTYGFWLLHLYLLTTVLYFLLTASDYHICIFWPPPCTSYLRVLITTFVSFDHCLVPPTYGFWLPHLYLLTTVLYFLLTASDDHICIFWPLSCTSYLRLLITTFVSFDHRLVLPTYGFWLSHLYLLTTVLYFLLTASDYYICIFWPLSCISYLRFWLSHLYLLTTVLYFLLTASDYHICICWPPTCTSYLRLLMTTFVSFDHCLVLPSYGFWLLHLYILTTVLYFLITASDYHILYRLTTVLYFLLTASDYHICIFWPLSCTSYLRLLITTFVSFNHRLVLPTYVFWLPHLYLLTTVLYFLVTASDYHICVFWPLSCTSYLRVLITTFVSFDQCLVLPTYGFWLLHLYLLTTLLYFLLTASDYHICIFWPLSCTSYLRLLITTFVSFDHRLVLPTYASDYHICIFWPLSCISYLRLLITTFVSFDHRLVLPTYGFWLLHLYLLTTLLYFLLTASDYHICIFWPLSCTSYLRLLITTFVSFDHRLVLPTYGFWLQHLYLLTTILYFLLTASDYHICIFWPPSCTSYLRFWLLHLYLLTTVLYFLLTSSDYHICIFWPLSCTSYLWLLITTFVSFDHSLVFPTYGFWLPHLYLLTTVLYFLLTASDYHICIFWPLSCISYLGLLITTFVSFDHRLVLPTYGFWLLHLYLLTTVLYFLLTSSDYHICIFWPLSCTSYLRLLITIFVSFDHSLVFPTYGFWLLHLYLLTTVLYFLLTASDYHICIFWPPPCTSYLRVLITTFVSFDHCLVPPTYGFWLPHLYLLTTVLYFLLTASDYYICIFWPPSCTSYLRLLITTFVSFDHSLVLPIYGFWLPHLYLLTTVLYFLLTASDYHICIFWPLSCTSYLRLLITTFVSFDHCLVLPTYGFWLPHLYLLTTVLYLLLTGSDYHICNLWPLSCTSYLRLLITTFVSFDHCLVLPTYGFWLPHLYLLTTVLYFLLTASDYHICIFWPPSCTSYLRVLITTFVSFDHCLVLPAYGFWLPHLYLLTTVLYFLLTASDYHICIFWPPSCTSYLRVLITTFVSFDHCLVLPTYGFWLPHLYLLTTVLYFLLTGLITTFISSNFSYRRFALYFLSVL